MAREQADKTAMENALARGKLLPAEQVAKADEVVYTALRDRVMAVRSEAPRLRDAAVKDGVAAVREILDRALSDALMDVGAKSLAGLQDTTGFAA